MLQISHSFTSEKPTEALWGLVLDLPRLVPCVEGGSVTKVRDDTSVDAKIVVRMGAMSMTFAGVVSQVESDGDSHTAHLRVKSREIGGQGNANADVQFALGDGGGTVETEARISGKAASMGEGVVKEVLEALIARFTQTFVATA
jgi:uncharacterized protein